MNEEIPVQTMNDIKSLGKPDNTEAIVQMLVTSKLYQRFGTINGVTAELSCSSTLGPNGNKIHEDGTIILNFNTEFLKSVHKDASFPRNNVFIGTECKLQESNRNKILCQLACYTNGFHKYSTRTYSILMALTASQINYLYVHNNREAYIELCSFVDSCDVPACNIWAKERIAPLSKICSKFVWEPSIMLDNTFSYTDATTKILTGLIKGWK